MLSQDSSHWITLMKSSPQCGHAYCIVNTCTLPGIDDEQNELFFDMVLFYETFRAYQMHIYSYTHIQRCAMSVRYLGHIAS